MPKPHPVALMDNMNYLPFHEGASPQPDHGCLVLIDWVVPKASLSPQAFLELLSLPPTKHQP